MKVTGLALVPPPAAAGAPKVTPELLATPRTYIVTRQLKTLLSAGGRPWKSGE